MPNMNSFVENRAAEDINFPVDHYTLHSDARIKFQMNRFYDWVGDPTMLTEIQSAARKIHKLCRPKT